MPLVFDTRLIRLLDQPHTHAHRHHQLVILLVECTKFEVNGYGGEVCRMHTCLVSDKTGHMLTGMGGDHMLIIDLDEDSPTPEDSDLLVRLFEAPHYPTLDVDFQNPLNYTGAEPARYGSNSLLTHALGRVLIRVLRLRLLGEQQSLTASGPLGPEHLDAHIMRNPTQRVTVAELARVAYLNPSHFHTRFGNSIDLTPHQYLFKVHLDYATRLLQGSRLPLARITEECGFSGRSALTTAMHRYLGLTPRSLCKD